MFLLQDLLLGGLTQDGCIQTTGPPAMEELHITGESMECKVKEHVFVCTYLCRFTCTELETRDISTGTARELPLRQKITAIGPI